jgi:hypothetical protein
VKFCAYLQFLDDAIDRAIVTKILSYDDFGFTPLVIKGEGFRKRPYNTAALKKFSETAMLGRSQVTGTDNDRFQISENSMGWVSNSWPTSFRLLEQASGIPGFVMAAAGDGDDMGWQGERQISEWDRAGRNHDHLPKIEGVFGPEIDTRFNPGRRSSDADTGLIFWATSTIWFGQPAFLYLNKERLLTSPVGQITELQNGTYRIDLYDPCQPEPEIRHIQRTFRDWMNYDELEANPPEPPNGSDPHITIDDGAFEHGGTRQYVEYLDDNKRPTKKSKATQKFVAEYSTNGTRIWAGIIPSGDN